MNEFPSRPPGRETEWIFGYGSLVWRPAFPFLERTPGWIEGWQRRFWQGSTDHRGVPGAPGRVVTLIGAPGSRCWGMAYRLDPDQRDETLADLDFREKNGYERLVTTVHLADGREVTGLTYLATEENDHYLGPAPLDTIAEQVRHATGPSGSNLDYVCSLQQALEEIGCTDRHVAALHRRLSTI